MANALGLAGHLIAAADGSCREPFNRRSLLFEHRLAGHPLFDLPRLAALCETLRPLRPKKLVRRKHAGGA
jgi:hypothetical protein